MSKHHREIPAQVWARLRRETFDRDSYRCRECQKAGSLEAHHTIPLSEWPEQPWTIAGLISLCRDCHLAIHRRRVSEADKEWLDFLTELG